VHLVGFTIEIYYDARPVNVKCKTIYIINKVFLQTNTLFMI